MAVLSWTKVWPVSLRHAADSATVHNNSEIDIKFANWPQGGWFRQLMRQCLCRECYSEFLSTSGIQEQPISTCVSACVGMSAAPKSFSSHHCSSVPWTAMSQHCPTQVGMIGHLF